MSLFLRFLTVFLMVSSFLCVHAQNIVINEIVASNQNGEMDDFFERDDWVEFYNMGGILNLGGYYLSDDPLNLTLWQIPTNDPGTTTVLPGSHIIFWIDRDPEQGADHADFSLSGDGETFILTDPDGVTVVDMITFPMMAPDISYGRVCDGCAEWQYFNNVTFDADNGEITPEPQILFINEVQPVNVSTVHDLQVEYDPWIEIYNPNPYQVNLGGYYLGTTGDPLAWQFPLNEPFRTIIPAEDFIVVWFDGDIADPGLHTSLSLSAGGSTIVLTALDGTTTTDSYTYPATDADKSYGRQSDGSVTSIVFDIPTPNVSNTTIPFIPPALYINEVLAANVNDALDNFDQPEDWFEVYNPNNFPVNLAGYYFTDNPENPQKWLVSSSFPDSVTVEPQGWLLFWADEDMTQGVMHASFRLNNTLESLHFYSPDGFTLVDEIYWQGLDPDTSYGRINDGAAQWVLFTGTTPDASNNQGTVDIDIIVPGKDSFSAYPNPTEGEIRFSRPIRYTLYTSDGREIMRGGRTSSLDLGHLSPGCYLLREDEGAAIRVMVH